MAEARADADAKVAVKNAMIASILNINDGLVDTNATLANVSAEAVLSQTLLTSLAASVDVARNALTAKRVQVASLAAAYRKLQARVGTAPDLTIGATDLDAAASEGKRKMVAAAEARTQAMTQAEADDIDELVGDWHADLPSQAPSPTPSPPAAAAAGNAVPPGAQAAATSVPATPAAATPAAATPA